jgi:hypothetical protein
LAVTCQFHNQTLFRGNWPSEHDRLSPQGEKVIKGKKQFFMQKSHLAEENENIKSKLLSF